MDGARLDFYARCGGIEDVTDLPTGGRIESIDVSPLMERVRHLNFDDIEYVGWVVCGSDG